MSEPTFLPERQRRSHWQSIVVDKQGQLFPLGRLVSDERLRRHVADMNDWDVLLRQLGCDSAGCGCGDGDSDARRRLAEVLEGAELFSLGFHGMMDALDR